MRVIEDWIDKNKPTPDPSREGSLETLLFQGGEPESGTSVNPSQGGTLRRGSYISFSIIIHIGSVPLGGTHPIRIQSMTNTNTLDTAASVAQCIRIIEAGADFVRLTAQGVNEARKSGEHKVDFGKQDLTLP